MQLSNIYSLFRKFPNIVTDTRKIVPNSIFFALKGENFNGNQFADSAIKQGCEFAIVNEEEYVLNDRFILVENVLTCLQNLAREHRRKLGIPILAITGTNGKTTTKELSNAVLQQKFNTCATQGNLNNHIGVPLTLLSMDEQTEFGIIEMGANHPEEIQNLCAIAEPNYGMITNVGKAHIEGFGSLEGVMKTKKELYDYLYDTNGVVFVNVENKILLEMLNQDQKYIAYGNSEHADSKAKFLQASPYLVLELRSEIGKLYVKTKLVGSYNFENILAAVTVGRYFKIDEVDIKKSLENYTPTNNRSQLLKTDHNVLFLDAYNANPTSMQLAIENFARLSMKNKVLILGDMLELGMEAEKEHQKLLDLLAERNFEQVFLVGKIFSRVNKITSYPTFKDTMEMISTIETFGLKNKNILIKGSRGIRLEKIIEKL
ncbi:UDP-N-acetylmuramoyl-tripeptide--D-alanyl-D-alanine ligase [Ancylomarina longa]|uniref:UDP-N-acetylmuramoyl-tripeptide--D-alanyl-D-alanine ligase n=1 Tax=Ancylomarina longa TaxID=2487017 RepID=A0A434AGX1_9BACT|nr:UDP-N-acetylmuramoyl-tripeptide--D-alanyl-D-alanine ligase [Ancylomarina longa]RUT73579.1 UDP-N-acetylmuramoyl-tripeptide--D-alanyl-D-alanine ligase [Ancylomarina longa]